MSDTMHARRCRARAPRDRRGFSIIELMAAVIILSIGVLALVGTSTLVSRMLGRARMQTEAATLAQTRFETLRGGRCPVTSGSTTGTKTTEKWILNSTISSTMRLYDVTDTVSYKINGVTKKQAFRSVIQCLP
ncbi:MAG: prepilin-type N-terminal cleavage/methylation domain-containing protein [Gemmatimonadaceae bacterium]